MTKEGEVKILLNLNFIIYFLLSLYILIQEKERTILVNSSIGLGQSQGNFKSDPWKKLLYNKYGYESVLKDYCEDTEVRNFLNYHK